MLRDVNILSFVRRNRTNWIGPLFTMDSKRKLLK